MFSIRYGRYLEQFWGILGAVGLNCSTDVLRKDGAKGLVRHPYFQSRFIPDGVRLARSSVSMWRTKSEYGIVILASLHMQTSDDLFGVPYGGFAGARVNGLIAASVQWSILIMKKVCGAERWNDQIDFASISHLVLGPLEIQEPTTHEKVSSFPLWQSNFSRATCRRPSKTECFVSTSRLKC